MEVKSILVVGCGAMGSGIAYVAASSGFNVAVADQSEQLVKAGLQRIREHLVSGVNRGKMTPKQAEQVYTSIKWDTPIRNLAATADMVIEAVFEDIEVKRKVFAELDSHCKPHTILASNTSSLSIAKIATATRRPGKVVGMHFFNPVPAMKLVEIVRTDSTEPETLLAVQAFVKRLGKEFVVVKDSPGFVVNRILAPFLNEVVWLLHDKVASPEEIDRALVLGANLPMGPLRLADYIGLDVVLATLQTLHRELGDKYLPCPTLVKMVEQGHLGMKSGKGFYEYR